MICFDSKLVRLKEPRSISAFSSDIRFYSKLVRLKVRDEGFSVTRQNEFLFQTGAIKRIFCVNFKCHVPLFRFQTGAIKR